MSKWFDANGTDVDAYPNEAFKGGVYADTRDRIRQFSGSNAIGLCFVTGCGLPAYVTLKDKTTNKLSVYCHRCADELRKSDNIEVVL